MSVFAFLDVEVIGSKSFPLVVDIGIVIADILGNTIAAKKWVVKEVVSNRLAMLASFGGFGKYEGYKAEPSKSMAVIVAEANEFLAIHGVTHIVGYNMSMDMKGLEVTAQELTGWEFFPANKYQQIDLYSMTKVAIFYREDFKKVAVTKKWTSQSGKGISQSLETAYKYVTGNDEYRQTHSALQDAKSMLTVWRYCMNDDMAKRMVR